MRTYDELINVISLDLAFQYRDDLLTTKQADYTSFETYLKEVIQFELAIDEELDFHLKEFSEMFNLPITHLLPESKHSREKVFNKISKDVLYGLKKELFDYFYGELIEQQENVHEAVNGIKEIKEDINYDLMNGLLKDIEDFRQQKQKAERRIVVIKSLLKELEVSAIK